MPLAEVFSETNADKNGLTEAKAVLRFGKNGRNVLPQGKPCSRLRLFFSQFNSPLIYILLATVAISFLLGHYSDSLFILFVLLINTIVGFYQENKTNQSLLALKKMVKVSARVMRDGNEKEIDSEELAVGDVVMLKSGDKIPADGRIIEAKGLKVNEASLTGESRSVEKKAVESLPEETPLPERANMVFTGAVVEEGWAKVIIVAVGLQSQIGEIVAILKETEEQKTPLQRKIAHLARLLSIFVLSVIFIILVEGILAGKDFSDIFVTSLALAVSAIPEGLLPAITVILVLGMRRIFERKGLVRKLVATETLGSVTVICTDKTGTITEGKMQVSHILTSTRELFGESIKGVAGGKNTNGVESHISALKIATLANDAFVENPEAELQEWVVRGRPTSKALLLAGMQAGLNKHELENQYPIIDRVNFESERKYSATLNRIDGKKSMLCVIGAPEEVMARSVDLDVDGKKEKLGANQAEKLIERIEALTKKGLRVIACARRDFEAKTGYASLDERIKNLSLVGFIALKDPLRPDAKESIRIAEKAGIRTIIITGDHRLTAKAIAEEIGIKANDDNIIEGKELECISDEDLRGKVGKISICARVSPRHKLRIVDALQANGEVVAMLGDGVNDAPALKAADIGVAVGSGTDVAKETADLVLLDDSFKTILKAIEQGRVIFHNIRKVFVYLVADDFSEMFIFLANMAMGLPLPLLPAQILWINLIEDGFPNIALTTEQETKGIMEEKPRSPDEPILNRPMKKWMAAVFFITGITAFLTFFILLKLTGDLQKARTMVFVLMCVDSLLFAFSVRSFKRTIFRKDIFSNRYLAGTVMFAAILLVAAIYVPLLQGFLGTRALGMSEWIFILGIGLAEIILVEFFKTIIFIDKKSFVEIK